MTGRGIIREHMDIYAGEKKVGVSTSGTHCPHLGYPAAMALVEKEYAQIGTKLQAEVRGRRDVYKRQSMSLLKHPIFLQYLHLYKLTVTRFLPDKLLGLR